jgi:hypothetical protein
MANDCISVKQRLMKALLEQLNTDAALLRQSITETQVSANEETRSSAGDKYETARAMAQLEIEKLTVQLNGKIEALLALSHLHTDMKAAGGPGAVMVTSSGRFFIAVNGGAIDVDGVKYTVISPLSPLAKSLAGRKTGESVVFMKNVISIHQVC